MDHEPRPQQTQCTLLMLPAELRNTIYSYILIQPSGLQKELSSRHRFCANVLQTCKQINQEASPILYGQNVFAAHPSLLAELPSLLLTARPSPTTLPPVLLPRPLSMIRRFQIRVRLDTDPRFNRKKLQESFSHAEELEVHVFQAMYGGCDFSVLELFDQIRDVTQARVVGSIGDGRYAAWLAASMMTPNGQDIPPYQHARCEESRLWNSWADGNR